MKLIESLNKYLKISKEDMMRVGYLRSVGIIGITANSLILILRFRFKIRNYRLMLAKNPKI